MAITLNKVGVEIDGKTYQFYKLSFGFQRKLIELQSELNKIKNQIAKKYDIDPEEINTSDKVSTEDKLEYARCGLSVQDTYAGLFVNPEEAKILENFDQDNFKELIEVLK